ncbi:LPP20 family lipoprotein [Idiomarina sp. Sol25]|uniref:LPP20 family lipoprotein n=1 Tax=Idiomarina sp. Sol25 TaxID=3064000 RepID=UPI00294B1FAC|nr:LPP20 family lipoprotein [Idiomarina sp. Sol25]MDV6327277.1 LPP20 family lipoprotein [Idiomarina sp. Sol25]
MFIRNWVVIIMTTFSFSLAAQELPSWIFEAKASSDELAAIGSGASINQAKRAAVAEIIAQVSQSVSAESVSVVEKRQEETSQFFKQSVFSETLSIEVNDVTFDKEYVEERSGVVYVRASLSKTQLIRFLEDELTPLATLSFPVRASPVDKVLWSLKFRVTNEYGLRVERALNALGAEKAAMKAKLRDNLAAVVEVWQRYGVRVIADNSLQDVAGLINRHIPSASKTVLWLQLKPSHKTRQQNDTYQHKLDLAVELTQPRTPFRIFRQEHISVVGSGSSAGEAESHALQQLRTILDTPIQNWLFEKGSEL